MASIYIHLHSWATGAAYLHNFLTKNQKQFASLRHIWWNINKDPKFNVHNQQYLLKEILATSDGDFSERSQKALDSWGKELEQGNNIILSYRSSDLANHFDKINETLDKIVQFSGYNRKYFINIARPVQIFREYRLIHPWMDETALLNILFKLGYRELYKKLSSVPSEDFQLIQTDLNPQINDQEAFERMRNMFFSFLNLPDLRADQTTYYNLAGKSTNAVLRMASEVKNIYKRPDPEKFREKLILYEQDPVHIDRVTISTDTKAKIEGFEKDIWPNTSDNIKIERISHSSTVENNIPAANFSAREFKKAFPAEWKFLCDNYPLLSEAQKNMLKDILPDAKIEIDEQIPKLTVLTMAFQHEKFIDECIESVAMQECNFPIRHVIVDDCSRDETRKLIEAKATKYPHITPVFLPRKERGLNIKQLFKSCQSEYAALCDGDDYFTDPHKLQKQVDFLDNNPDCGLCFHYVEARYENNEKPPFIYPYPSMLPRGVKEKYYLADLLQGNFIQTNSVVYRWRFRNELPDWFRSDLCPSDWYWHLLHAETGKIGFIPEVMSVYRRHGGSLYAKSFQATSKEHRRQHGFRELKTYEAVNNHFQDRYFRSVAKLADGVFSDFCKIMMDEDNSKLLDEAVEAYPKFGLHFLQELEKIQKTHPKKP